MHLYCVYVPNPRHFYFLHKKLCFRKIREAVKRSKSADASLHLKAVANQLNTGLSPLSILKIKSGGVESGLLACGRPAQGADNR